MKYNMCYLVSVTIKIILVLEILYNSNCDFSLNLPPSYTTSFSILDLKT